MSDSAPTGLPGSSAAPAPPETGVGTRPAIETRALCFAYNRERKALQDVTLSVPQGQIFGLLGPNGGGKTTLFRILSTLLRPDSGAAWIAGIPLLEDPIAVRKVIGVVFQSNSLDLELTVRENLLFQGHLYGMSGSLLSRRTTQLLERFGLANRVLERARRLSGGLRRRLELAKGLLHQPRVLLLDEPTAGVDPGVRHDFWRYLQLLRDQEGLSILVTTHLMDEAERCDLLAILNEGRVVASGPPDVLREKIGGKVIILQVSGPQQLASAIEERFGCRPFLLNGTLRLEHPDGYGFLTRLAEAFPGRILSATVGRPTLEDVFIQETGHKFWEEASKPG